jgi:16S rRNA (guanine1207-N2)-methyltransferase
MRHTVQGYRSMVVSQYFEESPQTASDPVDITVSLPDGPLVLRTDRGVFSRGALDAGTRLLLQEAPTPAAIATALDIGCGYGPVACALARRAPGATVYAVDINERARELTRHNAAANRLTNVTVVAPGEMPADVTFDLIWSNPPIRIGKPQMHELLRTWLSRLSPHGTAVLVVQKHLGSDSLLTWLGQQPWLASRNVSRLVTRQGYRLLQVGPIGEPHG